MLLLFLLAIVCSAAGCSSQRISDGQIDVSTAGHTGQSRTLRSQTSTLSGTVVTVVDGDSIEIRDDNRALYRVRLKGIDAPEGRQAYGNASRDSLARLVAGKRIKIEWDKIDQYNRIVGKVYVKDTDVCLEQIKAGLAWHFKRYAREQSATDQRSYAQAERDARLQKIGLWADRSPTPPWDFRQYSSR